MKKKKILNLMIVSFSFLLVMSIMSIKANTAALHPSNVLKCAKLDPLEENLKNNLSYSGSTLGSEDSTEFLIGFSEMSEEDKVINWVTNDLNAEIVAISNYTSLIHFKTNETKKFDDMQSLANTQQDFGVRYIQKHPENLRLDTWIPDDPLLGNQWYIDKIKAKEAWFYQKGSSSVKVAVLDSGVDIDHPDLEDNIETWSDWDYVQNDANPNAFQGPGANEGNAHGTKCAGEIAAIQNNTQQIAGLADIQLVNFRIFWVNWLGQDIWSFVWWVDAIYRAVDYSNADIISMSLGQSTNNTDLYEACKYAWEEGVLLIAAAGNNNWDLDRTDKNIYPAEYEYVMSVAATDQNDNKCSFSNYGDQMIDISAPGINIYTSTWGGGYTTNFQGTSASAPIVAGVAALILSHNPSYSLTDLWNALVDEADDIGNPQIRGRINAYYSVVNDYVPLSYQPGSLPSGSYHSGSLSNLKKVDSLYFTWRTGYVRLYPFIFYGFSVNFYFPDHYMSRLKIELSFGGKTCKAKIYWFGGGSSVVSFSGSLNYDCNSQRIDHITISYFGGPCPTYVYFDRVILVNL
jgi:thermitase